MGILDFLLPARCAGCDSPGADLCRTCAAAFASSPPVVLDATDGRPALCTLGPYDGPLRSAILALKFRGARYLGARLGHWLAPKIPFPVQAIVAVPLHPARLRERGYNQAAEIARGIAEAARLPLVDQAIVRTRATLPQSSLDLAQRQTNVDGAFSGGGRVDRVGGRRVLIVDDVVTSGATMRACAGALLAHGARGVYGAAAAVRR